MADNHRVEINLGLSRFRRSLRRKIRKTIRKQYDAKRRVEGKFVSSHLEFQGLKFKINYETQYLVSFIFITFRE